MFRCHTIGNAAWNCPRLGTFKTDSWLPTGRSGGKRAFVAQGLCFSRFAGRWHHTIRIRIRIARYNPDLPRKTTKKTQEFLILGEPLNSLGKKEKRSKGKEFVAQRPSLRLRGGFPSQRLSVLFPLIVLPLELQRAPNAPEFVQPRLSRVKRRSSPARGYKFGCVCSYMAGHYPGILMTGHIGTNTPKFIPPRWGRPRCNPTQTGLCKFGCVCRHRAWLDEEVTGRNEVTTTFFYVWPLWCACSFSGCEWVYCHGTLWCEFSIPKCGGVLGGNDQNRAEKQNVVLTWFRPMTWSSGHLGRRVWSSLSTFSKRKIRECH